MKPAKLPIQIQITGYIQDFLSRFAEAVLQGYEVLHIPYSPIATTSGVLMVTMELPSPTTSNGNA